MANKKPNNKDYSKFIPIPSQSVLRARGEEWKNLFEKYSNCEDEEEGLDWDELEALGEKEDAENKEAISNEPEASVEDDPDEDDSATSEVPILESKEARALKERYKTEVEKLGDLDLPFWKFQNEKIEFEETLKENAIEKPDLKLNSRNYRRTINLDRSVMKLNAPSSSRMPVVGNNFNFKRPTFNALVPNENTRTVVKASENDLPPSIRLSIQHLLQKNVTFSLKVREREYDIQVAGNEATSNEAATTKNNKMYSRQLFSAQFEPDSTLPDFDAVGMTLDEISCGSSLSDSSTDEEFFNKEKFALLREHKQLDHRHKKFLARTMGSEGSNQSSSSSSSNVMSKTTPASMYKMCMDSSDSDDDRIERSARKKKKLNKTTSGEQIEAKRKYSKLSSQSRSRKMNKGSEDEDVSPENTFLEEANNAAKKQHDVKSEDN